MEQQTKFDVDKTSLSLVDMEMEPIKSDATIPAFASMKNAFSMFESQMLVLQTELNQKNAVIRQHKQQLDESFEKIDQSERSMQSLMDQVQKLKNDLKSKQSLELKLQEMMTRNKERIDQLSNENVRLDQIIQEKRHEAEQTLKEKDVQLDKLRGQITEREQKIKQLSDDLNRFIYDSETKQSENEAMLNRKQELIVHLTKENEQLKEKNNQTISSVNEVNGQLLDIKQNLLQTANEKRALEESLMELTKKYKQLADSNSSINQEYESTLERYRQMLDKLEEYSSENMKLAKQVNELKVRSTAAIEKERQLQQELDQLKTKNAQDLAALKKMYEQDLGETRTAYENKLRQQEMDLERANEQFKSKENLLRKLLDDESETKNKLEATNNELQMRLERNRELLIQNGSQISFLDEKKRELQAQMEEKQQTYDKEAQLFLSQIHKLEDDNHELQQQINEMNASFDLLKVDKHDSDIKVSDLRLEVAELKRNFEVQSKEKLSLNEHVFELREKLHSAKDDLDETMRRLSDRDQVIVQLEQKLTQQNLSERILLTQIGTLKNEISDWKDKWQQSDYANQHLNEKIDQLTVKLEETESRSQNFKEELEFLNTNVRLKSEKELQHLKELKELSVQLDQLGNEKAKLQRDCELFIENEAELKRKIDQESIEKRRWQNAHDQLAETIQTLKSEIRNQEQQSIELSDTKRNLERQMEELKKNEIQFKNENQDLKNWLTKYNLVFKKHLPNFDTDHQQLFRDCGSLKILDPEEIRKIFIYFDSKLNEIESTTVDFEQELDTKERLMMNLKQQIEQTTERADALESETRSLDADNVQLRSELESLRKQFDSKESKLAVERKYISDKLVKLELINEELVREKQLLQDENRSLLSLKESMERKVQANQATLGHNEQTIQQLKQEFYDGKFKIGQLSVENMEKSKELAQLRSQLEQNQFELHEAKEALIEARGSISQTSLKEKHFEANLDEMRQKLTFHESSSKEIIKKVSHLEEQLQRLTKEKEQLEQEVQHKTEIMLNASQTNHELRQKMDVMESDLTLYRNMLNKFCLSGNAGSGTTSNMFNECSPLVNNQQNQLLPNGRSSTGYSSEHSSGHSIGQSSANPNGYSAGITFQNEICNKSNSPHSLHPPTTSKAVPTRSKAKRIQFDERSVKTEKPADAKLITNIDHLNNNLKAMTINCKDVQKRIRSLKSLMEKENDSSESALSELNGKSADSVHDKVKSSLAATISSGVKKNSRNPKSSTVDSQRLLSDIERILSKKQNDFSLDTDKISSELERLEHQNAKVCTRVLNGLDAEMGADLDSKTTADNDKASRSVRLREAKKYAENVIRSHDQSRRIHAQLTESRKSSLKQELLQSFDPSCTPALFKKPVLVSSQSNQVTSTPMLKQSIKQRLDYKFK